MLSLVLSIYMVSFESQICTFRIHQFNLVNSTMVGVLQLHLSMIFLANSVLFKCNLSYYGHQLDSISLKKTIRNSKVLINNRFNRIFIYLLFDILCLLFQFSKVIFLILIQLDRKLPTKSKRFQHQHQKAHNFQILDTNIHYRPIILNLHYRSQKTTTQ